MNPRCLKIEADGDPWRGTLKPKIRLVGRWLEQMGFPPEHHVEVSMIEPGLLQIKLKSSAQQTETNDHQIGNGEDCGKLALHSFEHCINCMEQLKQERRHAFSTAWREHCKREIADWMTYIAAHYPNQRVSKGSNEITNSDDRARESAVITDNNITR